MKKLNVVASAVFRPDPVHCDHCKNAVQWKVLFRANIKINKITQYRWIRGPDFYGL